MLNLSMISNIHSLKLFNLLSSLFFLLTSLPSTWAYSLVGNTLTDLSGTGSYFTDVEAAAWTLSGELHPPSKTYVCNGTYLLGGYGVLSGTKNGWFQRQYDGLPAHNQISLTVMIWPLDSWDGTSTDDHFELSFDGVVHYAWRLSGFAGYATKVCGNPTYTDYPPFQARLSIPHTSSSLIFAVISQLDENSENESVGFRDITMTFETVASPTFTMCGYSPGSPLPTAPCDCPQTNQYQYPPSSGSCIDCHSTCKTCDGGTSSNCLSCYDGSYLSNNQCITCPANCATCYGGSVTSCITCKSTFPYMVNGNQCVTDCNYPLVTGMNGTIQTCNTPCPGQYVFSWDSYCSPNCSTILLSPAKYDTFDICNYPCTDNQYQYWDAVCDNSCAYPTVPRVFHNKNFCDYPCAISTYSLYWDGTCEQTCPLPLTSQPFHGKILCKYTCADNEYLYWDGSCGATCFYPQIIRFYHNKQFCDFRCASNEYLYWNNSCITTCTFPLVPRYERSVKFCDYPCSGSQYLYWNGSCLATCNSPLVARVVGSSRFCDFPCADNVMLRWDGVCGGTCDSPRIVKTEGYPMVRTFCVFPCADSEYLYWNGTCKSACNPPLVTVVQQNRSFCSYPCDTNQYLYWNGSCKSNCSSPLTPRVEASLNYCDYNCATSEYLYWNGSCKSSCTSPPLTAKTVDGNNFCYYPCNTSEYLYWDGSCRASCAFPLTTRTEDSRNYCDFSCTGSNYLYWNGSCISTCTLFTPRVDSTKNFCDFQCNPTAYIYWDGACSDSCASPLIYYTEGSPMVRYFCKFPCATNEILYWNGTCSATCSFPLVQRTQNSRQFCSLPCTDTTNFVYWNGSCKATCPSPLVTRIDSSGKYCDYPCLGSEYLYWNGSCKASCATPLTSKVINGNNFCYYTCTDTTQYLYWDGTCSSTCNSPLDAVTEGTPIRKFCRFDCNTNEYLYWNGSCIAGCAYPLTSSTSKSRSFCTYPCSASQYLYWDKTCGSSCPYPLTTRVEGTPSSNNYCDFPCSGSNYLYWNSSCSPSCPSPYKTRTQNSKNFCDYPCPTSQYVYSDSSCADTCTSPNVIRVEASRNYCDYPCSSGFLYWNGSCLSTCQSPLKIRYSQGNAYCDYSCSTTQFLYWNGSCFSGCASPLVTRVEASRNYCDYLCQAGFYLYWNGTCGTCPSPLSTQIVAGDKYCNYNCAANQILYWDGSCSTSCLSPRTLVTEGTPARNYCRYSCNTNQYLYWNGTCTSSCLSPLVSQTYNSRLFCVYSCATTEFLNWDGTCITSCPLPYTYRLEAEHNYCDFPCPTGQFLYWNGTCSPTCDSPLTAQTINSRKFCNFPCPDNEFLYWDGSCNSTCPSPLAQVIEGDTTSRKFCKHTCTTSTDFLYWNGSCASTCSSPLVSQTLKNKKICQFPCDPQSFVYWDGTCLPTCPSPLTSRVEAGMKYCTYGCASNQFLYWNGSCLNYCGSLFVQRTDRNRLFCDYPCGSVEYLYWNGTCMNNCPSPFLSTVQTSTGNRKFCNFPCTTSQFLNWNEVCQDQCNSPYRHDVSTSGRYCYMPCSTSTQYYYPDSGLCNTTCESPYESNNTLPYLQCIKTEVVETPEETKGPVFTALLMAPTGNGTFTIVKVVKVMQYVRFLKIELPPRLARLGASQGRSILSFQSNSRLLSEKSQVSDLMQSSLPSFFARQGLDSTFIVNFWGNFIFILSTILAAAVLTLFEKCCRNLEWKLLEAIFKRLRVIARWNLFIMLIATNIDDIILYTTIEFKSIHTTALPAVNQFSLAMCVLFLILTAVLLVGMFLLIERYYKNKKSVSKNTLSLINFDAKWIDMQVVLKGFRSNTLWNRYFYLLYTVRIGFPMLITVCAESVPLLIAIVQALTSVLIVLYLIRIKPFKRQINQVQLIIFESLVLIMNLCMFILTVIYISGGQYGDFGAVLGDIVIIGNDLINVITPVFLVIRVFIEARAIYLYIKSLKDKSMIEKTRYLQLIALFFQQANMGFEEVLEDHTPLTTQVTAIPLAKQVGKDFDVSTRRALVSQKTDRNKQDLSMESQRLDDSSRIIVVSNVSQVFVRSESRGKSDDSWLPDISGGYRGQLSESVVTPNRLDESKVVSVDLEGDDLNTSNVGNYKKKLEIVSEEPIKTVIKDHTPTPNFNESVFVFDITKGAEENEIEIKPIKIKVEKARKKTPESESATVKSHISKPESKRVMIVDPTFSPESPTLLKQVEEEQSPQAEVSVKRPPKSSPLVYRSFYQPIVSKVRRPEGTKKAKTFLNYDWKNVSGITPEGESPTEDSPVGKELEKAKSSEGLSISDMDDIKDNSPDKMGVNASSIMLESANNLSARLKRFNTSLVKKSNDDEGSVIIPSLRRSPSDYIKSRLAVEGRNKSVGKQKQVGFNF